MFAHRRVASRVPSCLRCSTQPERTRTTSAGPMALRALGAIAAAERELFATADEPTDADNADAAVAPPPPPQPVDDAGAGRRAAVLRRKKEESAEHKAESLLVAFFEDRRAYHTERDVHEFGGRGVNAVEHRHWLESMPDVTHCYPSRHYDAIESRVRLLRSQWPFVVDLHTGALYVASERAAEPPCATEDGDAFDAADAKADGHDAETTANAKTAADGTAMDTTLLPPPPPPDTDGDGWVFDPRTWATAPEAHGANAAAKRIVRDVHEATSTTTTGGGGGGYSIAPYRAPPDVSRFAAEDWDWTHSSEQTDKAVAAAAAAARHSPNVLSAREYVRSDCAQYKRVFPLFERYLSAAEHVAQQHKRDGLPPPWERPIPGEDLKAAEATNAQLNALNGCTHRLQAPPWMALVTRTRAWDAPYRFATYHFDEALRHTLGDALALGEYQQYGRRGFQARLPASRAYGWLTHCYADRCGGLSAVFNGVRPLVELVLSYIGPPVWTYCSPFCTAPSACEGCELFLRQCNEQPPAGDAKSPDGMYGHWRVSFHAHTGRPDETARAVRLADAVTRARAWTAGTRPANGSPLHNYAGKTAPYDLVSHADFPPLPLNLALLPDGVDADTLLEARKHAHSLDAPSASALALVRSVAAHRAATAAAAAAPVAQPAAAASWAVEEGSGGVATASIAYSDALLREPRDMAFASFALPPDDPDRDSDDDCYGL